MYLELLQAHNTITVMHPTNNNYTPTRFELINGKVNYFNSEIGHGEHPNIQTEEELARHFENMLYLGFRLEIQNTNKH